MWVSLDQNSHYVKNLKFAKQIKNPEKVFHHTSISRIRIWNREETISFPNAESNPGLRKIFHTNVPAAVWFLHNEIFSLTYEKK